jgi:hypothetical protein
MPYLGNLLGAATVSQPDLKNYTILKTSKKDSVTNQIRIKLSDAFLRLLVGGDSSKDKPNNFYYSDSVFKSKFKGLAVIADGGNPANGLFYINLADAKTRLEIYHVASNAAVLGYII